MSTLAGATDHDVVARIDNYLGQGLLPLWASRGWDGARGGWHDRLSAGHAPVDLGYRRLTVCARQLFVYSRATMSGLQPGAQAIAEQSFRYLVDHFADSRLGGWFFKVDLDGAPLDRAKDLYGHAFALFGLAQYVAMSGDDHARELLVQTERAITRHFLQPEGWYAASAAADWSSPDRRLLQNPHMHLLEAYLAAYAITRDTHYRTRAQGLIALLRTRLLDPATHTIA
jgi:mannose/cellobiose epimerase-like protein (N-acyl-D-glucosamine 2-epimerase family)